MKIEHNYLPMQFADCDEIIAEIRSVVQRGDFTLGREVQEFEQEFRQLVGTKHAIAVGNGTEAIFLALKALGVNGGEIITSPYSFYATSASIVHAGARPVYVDVGKDFNIDPDKIEAAITAHTAGIVLVHWAGYPCRMRAIEALADKYGLWIVEDCAHAPGSMRYGKQCGSFGTLATFSLHPLKNLNVWGDGGIVVTDRDDYAAWLRQARNHGMSDRNTAQFWGWNSRLDTVQAVVARHVLKTLDNITRRRRNNAYFLDNLLLKIPGIELLPHEAGAISNYYLYCVHACRRDELAAFLNANGIDAKMHYPIPLHLQPAAKSLGYKRGDFPTAEWCAETTISFPIHEFVNESQLWRIANFVHAFYDQPEWRGLCEGT